MNKGIIFLVFFLLCSCNSGNKDSKDVNITLDGNMVTVGADSPIAAKLQTSIVKKTDSNTSLTASGVVRAIPSAYAEVAPPFSGRITASFVKLGQQVHKGSPLFEISSPELFEVANAHFQADQQMNFAEKNLKRQKMLFEGKMCSVRELEEAQTQYNSAIKEHESSRAALLAYGVDPDNASVGQPLTIISPVAGRIVKNSLVIGQFLKDDAEPQIIVADLSKVWVVANVKEHDLKLLSKESSVAISLISAPDETITGSVINISELLDPDTRSVEVIIECDNERKLLKPNMYGTVIFTSKSEDVLVIPNSAVLQDEGHKYVFVKEGLNSFRKKEILTYETEDDSSIVSKGLSKGDEIITRGAFYLVDVK